MGDPKTFFSTVNKLSKSLTKKQIEILKHDYPYPRERNSLIRQLRQKGVSCYVLAHITGISKSSIHRMGGRPAGVKRLRTSEIRMIEKACDAFCDEIKTILQVERR